MFITLLVGAIPELHWIGRICRPFLERRSVDCDIREAEPGQGEGIGRRSNPPAAVSDGAGVSVTLVQGRQFIQRQIATRFVEQMAAAIRDHLFARELLAEGVAEGVVRCA